MLQWSDQTLLFSVWSDGVPAFSRAKTMEIVGPDSGCVRSVVIGRVRSRLQGIWTSLESTRLWVAASGPCHRSVQSVDIVRDPDSSLFPFLFHHGDPI